VNSELIKTPEFGETMSSERRIGVALDFSKGSKIALKWAIDNLLRKGDTLLIVHIKHTQGSESRNLLWSTTGSRKLLFYATLTINPNIFVEF